MGAHDRTADRVQPSWLSADAKAKVREILLDCDANNVAQNDVEALFKFTEKVVVHRVEMIVKTAEGGTLTLDVGDYSDAGTTAVDADGFLYGANGNAAAGTLKSSTELTQLTESPYTVSGVNYRDGRYLAGTAAAPKYLAAKFNNAADAAQLLFRVYYSEVSGL